MRRIIINLIVILFLHQILSAAALEDETSELSREMLKQCGTMLASLRQVKAELETSEAKDTIIRELRDKLVQQEMNEALIKELRREIDFQKRIDSCSLSINSKLIENYTKCRDELENKSIMLELTDAEMEHLNSSLTAMQKQIDRINISKNNLELKLKGHKNKIHEANNNLKLCQIEVEKSSKLHSQEQAIDQLPIKSKLIEECERDLTVKSNKLEICELQLTKLNSSLIEKDESISRYNAEIHSVIENQKKVQLQLVESQIKLLKKQQDNKFCHSQNYMLNRTIHNNTPANCTGKIEVPGVGFIDVVCDNQSAGPGWFVIYQRIRRVPRLDRDWATYREGFGSMHDYFFFGLEKIYLLTSSLHHELYVHLVALNGSTFYAHYDDFKISDESNGYALSLGEWHGNEDNLFSYHEGMKFSTHDRNNNKYDPRNCASDLANGWWYKDCGICDFNGLFIRNQHCDFNVKEVKMLIRPKQ